MSYRSCLLAILLLSSLTLTGCLDTVLGVLLAPELVVAQSVNQAAQAGAQSLTEMGAGQIADAGQAVTDIDRLIRNSPDASNLEQLVATRDWLAQRSETGKGKRGGAHGDRILLPPPRSPMPHLRCVQGCPDTLPDGGAIAAGREEPWAITTNPVRLR
jgi:hypothetical protein